MCARFLARYPGRAQHHVHVIAIGETGVPALHAAALEPDLFASVKIVRSIPSWAQAVRTPPSRNQLINTVHGALRVYDLPDLARTLPAAKLAIVEPVDAAGQPIR